MISGEKNLLSVSDFSSDMGHLRRAFDLFEQKTQLMRLLDISAQADGVRIFIGGESQIVPIEELSIVSAPYEVDGRVGQVSCSCSRCDLHGSRHFIMKFWCAGKKIKTQVKAIDISCKGAWFVASQPQCFCFHKSYFSSRDNGKLNSILENIPAGVIVSGSCS